MRLRDRKTRGLLVLILLLLAGFAAYRIGRHAWAGYHYRAAQQALAQRDFHQGRTHLDICLAVWPGDLEVRLLAAQTARRQWDFDRAAHHLQLFQQSHGPPEVLALEHALLRLQSGDLVGADQLLAHIGGPESAEGGLVLEAVIEGHLKALQTAAEMERLTYGAAGPTDVAPLARLVDEWLAHRRTRADQVQGLFWRGLTHYHAKDYPRTLADLREVLELDPDHRPARLLQAQYLMTENPQRAADQLRLLRRRFPEDTAVALALGAALHSLGQLDEAGRLLDEILTARPHDVAALVGRARIALDLSQPQDAEGWLRRALQLAPNSREVNFTLGRCLQQMGRLDEAKQYQDRFQRIEAEEKRSLNELVRLKKP